MLAYLFPGQGSQKIGMGSDLFDCFSDLTALADEILGYSIKSLCCEDKHAQLNLTQYTQPALFVVNTLSYLKTLDDSHLKPDYVAGHSLGEYNALFAAEVFDFTTGLTLVKKRGELMSQAQGGSMAAVIGLQREEMDTLLQDNDLSSIAVANFNSYQQLVLSGPKEDIDRTLKVLSSNAEVRYIPLPVSGAFHSPYMTEAQKAFSEFLLDFEFSTPKLPVMANVNAAPYHPSVIKRNLTSQISQPVEWTKTIEYLQTKPNITFKEIGPGNVLTNLCKRIHNGQ